MRQSTSKLLTQSLLSVVPTFHQMMRPYLILLFVYVQNCLSGLVSAPSPSRRGNRHTIQSSPTFIEANNGSQGFLNANANPRRRAVVSQETCDSSAKETLTHVLQGVTVWAYAARILADPRNVEGTILITTYFHHPYLRTRHIIGAYFQGLFDEAALSSQRGRILISCTWPSGYCEHDERRYTVTYGWQNTIYLVSISVESS